MKAIALALVGTLATSSNAVHAENLPANTVPPLPGADVRSIGQKPCNLSLQEWTHDSQTQTLDFYANWATSKGLKLTTKPSASTDFPLWFFADPQTHESVTLMFGPNADHNFVAVNYEAGTKKQGCPDSPMIR